MAENVTENKADAAENAADTADTTENAADTADTPEGAAVTADAPESAGSTRNERKTRLGTVVSTKMDKTIVVTVERRTAHKLYGKQLLRTKKFHVHDEEGQAREGDRVRIMETRPLSKTKRWRLTEIVMRAE